MSNREVKIVQISSRCAFGKAFLEKIAKGQSPDISLDLVDVVPSTGCLIH
jgi:hypothetical protein